MTKTQFSESRLVTESSRKTFQTQLEIIKSWPRLSSFYNCNDFYLSRNRLDLLNTFKLDFNNDNLLLMT